MFCVAVPAIVTAPLTVAEPALIFHALVAFPVGWFRVTAPLTVSTLEPPWVSELAEPPAVKLSDEQVLLLFIVVAEPLSITRAANVVLFVPPMDCVVPLNVVVEAPAVNEPLFVQVPSKVILKLLADVLSVP